MIESKRIGMSLADILDGTVGVTGVPSIAQSIPSPSIRMPIIPMSFKYQQPVVQPSVSAFSPIKPAFIPAPATFSFKSSVQEPIIPIIPLSIPFNFAPGPVQNLATVDGPIHKLSTIDDPAHTFATVDGQLQLPSPSKSIIEKFESVKEEMYRDFIEDEVVSTVVEVHAAYVLNKDAMMAKKNLLHEQMSKSIFGYLLQEVINDIASERLMITQSLDVYRSVLSEIATELIEETLQIVVRRIVMPLIMDSRKKLFYGRFGWDRWRYSVMTNMYERQKQDIAGRRMLSFLRQSVLIPSFDHSPTPQIDLSDIRLSSVAQEMMMERATWYEKIKMDEQVLPFLEMLALRYKIGVVTCGTGMKSVGSLAWFTDTWMCAKLGGKAGDEGVVTLGDEAFSFNGMEETRVLVRHCDVGVLAGELERKVFLWLMVA